MNATNFKFQVNNQLTGRYPCTGSSYPQPKPFQFAFIVVKFVPCIDIMSPQHLFYKEFAAYKMHFYVKLVYNLTERS